jgi:histone acetyltransferase SAS3
VHVGLFQLRNSTTWNTNLLLRFCHQDEEHDPSEDFEEYMACAVCGDNCKFFVSASVDQADEAVAHRQCARDADALKSDEGEITNLTQVNGQLNFPTEAENWRCPGCVSNALEPEIAMADAGASLSVRRSSAPKLARDLLPSQRGAIKPDSHSVFNHLIVDNDPMDGSRLLRKRKTSSVEADTEVIISPTRKRRKDGSGAFQEAVAEEETPGAADEAEPEPSANEVMKEEPISPRASRSLRPKSINQLHATIAKKTRDSLIIHFNVDPIELRHITSQIPKPKKKRNRSQPSGRTSVAPTYIPPSFSQPFYSFHDRENDELKSKPYGGILTEAEADTSKTLPQPDDRRRFDDARQRAEEEWKVKTETAAAEAIDVKKPRKVSGPASQIECINFGGYEIDTWYASPYPEEYSRNRVLYICEFCLKYMNSDYVAWRHKLKCQAKHPPGDEIYRDGSVAVFEVDGRKNPVYCQNLCLLAKLFLGSKTLYYDVEPFLFYVMTEYDELGCHFVGYFSKEKRPSSQNNVSCILTLPIHQRKGYGNLLIDFSYLLTRVEKKSGSPEKPLSDMGLVSYRNYWRLVLCYDLRFQKGKVSIADISDRTGMTADDIVSALEGLRALVRDPVTGTYALRLDFDFYDEYVQTWENKKYVKLNPKGLVWTPYIMGRNNTTMVEHAPPLNTMAPREGDEEDEENSEKGTQLALTNGNSQSMINGFANGDILAKDEPQQDGAETEVNGLTKAVSDVGLGEGDSIIKTPSKSPQSARLRAQQQSLSAPPKINGFNSPSKPAPIKIEAPSIPPTRFEVFPPVPGARSTARPKPSSSRPAPRQRTSTSGSASRPRQRSSGDSSRRSTTSRPRSSSSRKRSGGTGRGPGRWPKGTKKSDFGNADSGPGLPPKNSKQRSRLGNEVTLGDEEEDLAKESEIEEEFDEDAILYETPGPRRKRPGETSRARGRVSLGKPKLKLGKPTFERGKGKGKGKVLLENDEDEDMEVELVVGDIDAEGEEE